VLVIGLYFQLGFQHLMAAGAWDHQLFLALIALANAPVRWRRWIGLATLFAVGHSLAIVAMSQGWVPSHLTWVEPAILASLVVMAVMGFISLRQNPLGIIRYERAWLANTLASGFGVVHGLGFGGAFLSVALRNPSPSDLAQSLLGFTLGVELAQVLILLGFWLAAWLLFDLLQWRPLFLRKLLMAVIGLISSWMLLLYWS